MHRTSAGRAVTYELTGLGAGMLDLLATVYAWSDEHDEHHDELLDAYDPDGPVSPP